jgi:hypothetical protein
MINILILAISCLGQTRDTPDHLGEHGHFQLVKEYVTGYQFSPPPSDLRVYYIWVADAKDPVYVPPDTCTPRKITLSPYGSNHDAMVLTRKPLNKEISIDNKPKSGYILEGTNRLKSPDGFRVPLSRFTLEDILMNDKIDNGVIAGKLIWIAIDTETLIVRYDSEFYKSAAKR